VQWRPRRRELRLLRVRQRVTRSATHRIRQAYSMVGRFLTTNDQAGVTETFREIGYASWFAGRRNIIAPRERGFGPDAAQTARGAGDKPGDSWIF
jgi:hypothetical protein